MSRPTKNPVVYGELPQFSAGDVITALEFNKIIDRLRSQGDINAQWCAFLQNEGIPAAIADVSAEDVASYISASITTQLNNIVASSEAKTTDYWNEPTIAIIATPAIADTAYDEDVWDSLAEAGVTKHIAGQEADEAGVYCYNWYSGGSITSLSEAAREQEFEALANCAQQYCAYQPIIAYTESTVKLADTYWKDNVYAYAYISSDTEFPTCSEAAADVLDGYIPVQAVDTAAGFTALLNTVSNADFAVIAVPIDVLCALDPDLSDYTVLSIGEYISKYKQCTGNHFGRVDKTSNGPSMVYTNVYTGNATMHLNSGATWYSFKVSELTAALSTYVDQRVYCVENEDADDDDPEYIRKPIRVATTLLDMTATVEELNHMSGIDEDMTDLLDGKADSEHTHEIGDIAYLNNTLLQCSRTNHTHDHLTLDYNHDICTAVNAYQFTGFSLKGAVTGNTALYTNDFIEKMNVDNGTAWLVDYYCSDFAANITSVSVQNNQITVTYDKQIQGTTCWMKASWADALNLASTDDSSSYSNMTLMSMNTEITAANTALVAARTVSDDDDDTE